MTRRHIPRAHSNHERWLVSYADFITLLFAFFVVLYAASKSDQKKQQQVSQAIDSGFRALGLFSHSAKKSNHLKDVSAVSQGRSTPDQPVTSSSIVTSEQVLSPADVKEDLERMQDRLEQLLSSQIASHTVSIQMGKDGLVISLREAGFFTSGSATPHATTLSVLQQIASTLGTSPYNVRIEGHTDNVPIHTQEFDSNWELSSARATRVARIFLATRSIPPDRLSAAGYAEFHPASTNETEAGRGENRRVDLVVLPRTRLDFTMPNADTSNAKWHKISDR